MSRVEKFKDARARQQSGNLAFCSIIGTVILIILIYSIIVNVQNNRMKDFIMSYDKTKEVWHLQQDLKGGNF